MLISHRYKFIYLKTTKTAGTSVEVALEPYALPINFKRDKENKNDAVVTEYGIVGARGKCGNQHQWFHHMGARKVKAQIGDDIWNSYYKFCNIRNPWDKTVSAFHFHHSEIKNEKKEIIFRTFKDWLEQGENLMHDRAIYFINNAPVADDVIRYETLASDLHRICNRFGVPTVEIPTLKSKERGAEKIDFREYYNEKSKKLIEKLYNIEIHHYGWSFD